MSVCAALSSDPQGSASFRPALRCETATHAVSLSRAAGRRWRPAADFDGAHIMEVHFSDLSTKIRMHIFEGTLNGGAHFCTLITTPVRAPEGHPQCGGGARRLARSLVRKPTSKTRRGGPVGHTPQNTLLNFYSIVARVVLRYSICLLNFY